MKKEIFSKAGQFMLDASREAFKNIVDEEVFVERIWGIETTVKAMRDAGVSEEIIIAMLQKNWDLRLSEAENFVK